MPNKINTGKHGWFSRVLLCLFVFWLLQFCKLISGGDPMLKVAIQLVTKQDSRFILCTNKMYLRSKCRAWGGMVGVSPDGGDGGGVKMGEGGGGRRGGGGGGGRVGY